jgi:hypothetical protein
MGGKPDELWIDVAQPLRLSDQPEEIVDDELEREWPGQPLTHNYWIIAQQYRIVVVEGKDREELVRSFDLSSNSHGNLKLPINIPSPGSPASEVETIKEIGVA